MISNIVYFGADRVKKNTIERFFYHVTNQMRDLNLFEGDDSFAKFWHGISIDFRSDFEDAIGEVEENALFSLIDQTLAAFENFRNDERVRSLGVRSPEYISKEKSAKFFYYLFEKMKDRKLNELSLSIPKVSSINVINNILEIKNEVMENSNINLKLEILLESPQAIFQGSIFQDLNTLNKKNVEIHFGPYDYLSHFDLPPKELSVTHPISMKGLMEVQLKSVMFGYKFNYGAINHIPDMKSKESINELFNIFETLHRNGMYDGWILHPSQFVIKVASLYDLISKNVINASSTLTSFLEGDSKATLEDDQFHDQATINTLTRFLSRFKLEN